MDYVGGNEAVSVDLFSSCDQVCTIRYAIERLSDCISRDWVCAIRKIDLSLLCGDGDTELLSKSQLHLGFSRLSEVTLPWCDCPLTEWIANMTAQDTDSFTRNLFEARGYRKAIEDQCIATFNSSLQTCHYDTKSPRPFACVQHFYIGELSVCNASGIQDDQRITDFEIERVMVLANNTLPTEKFDQANAKQGIHPQSTCKLYSHFLRIEVVRRLPCG